MDYRQSYSEIVQRLEHTRSKETRFAIGTSFMKAIGVSVLFLLVLAIAEAFIHASMGGRTAMFVAWCIVTGAALVYFVGTTAWYRVFGPATPSIDSVALRVGNAYQDIRDMLLNAMQLVPVIENSGGSSGQLALAVFDNISKQTQNRDFDIIIDKEQPKRIATIFLSVVVGWLLLCAFTPLGQATNRIMHFRTSFLPPAPFGLTIQPSSLQVLRGEKVTITVKATGTMPQQVTLQMKEDQQQTFDAYTLREDQPGVYTFEIPSVKRTVEFYAESPWLSEFVRTVIGRIIVTDRPLIRSLNGKVIQPAYTGLGVQQLSEQSADITCLAGSRVELEINANKDLKSARVVMLHSNQQLSTDTTAKLPKSDTSFIPLAINGRQGVGAFSVRGSGLYWIELVDTEGRTNADPIRYTITTQTDGYPTISLLEPITDTQLPKEATITVRSAVTDDYGFSGMKLMYRLAESRYAVPDKQFHAVNIPMGSIGVSGEVSYLWDLNALGISPEDKYEFYVEVFDNDRVTGPKSAKTSTLSVRLPSLDEVFKQADKTQKDAIKELEQVMKKAEYVAKDMEQLQRDMMKQKQMQADWKDKKKMDELMKQQEEIQQKVQDVQQKLEEMTQQLQENKALSPETMQKYMELQKLMQKIDSKELREQMQKMQEAMKQMSPEQMQEAMKNFKFNEEDFKKQIERTMQLLKRMQTEQKIDELAKRAEQLQQQQEQLQKQAENTNPNDKQAREELAKKQQAMKEDFQKLSQELKDLQQMMKEAGLDKQQNVMDEMKKAMDQLNQDMTKQEMEQSQQDLENGDMQKAQQNMKNAQQNMKNFAQGMKKMKQEMKKNLNKELAKSMQQSMNDMMQLSKAQEQLMKESQQMDPNSTKFGQNAQQQQKLQEQLMNLANRMNQMSQKSTAITPEMGKQLGDAMRQMQGAQQSMEQRNGQQAGGQQQGAMSSMNQAMQSMSQALQQMNGSKPGSSGSEGEDGDPTQPGGKKPGQGSFMQRLQQAAQMQQGINQGMQQMQQGQGRDQQSEMGRLLGQQGKVQKTMEELANEQKQMGGDKKALGNLERMAEEMKEILSDMQSGNVTEETRRRQDKILSRLLDATRSMNERDYEKTRESRSGTDVVRKSPGALDLNTLEGRNKAYQDMLKSMQQGYTKDYEAIIRQYFEQLQKQGVKQQ
ncbi:MAG: DUF4175 family protein [Candidatus Kapaibacterium sp.]